MDVTQSERRPPASPEAWLRDAAREMRAQKREAHEVVGYWTKSGRVWNDIGGAVQLWPHQLGHFENLLTILQKRTSALDTSVMGTGKTYTSLALAIWFRMPIFVICPVAAVNMWRATARMLGVPVIEIISYDSLRGRVDVDRLSHPWLIRENIVKVVEVVNDRGEKEKVERHFTKFRATHKLLETFANGSFFIFDEVQKIRNPCAQTMACHAILKNLLITNISPESKRRSFALTLSATPAISIENIIRLARFMCIIQSDHLYTKSSKGTIQLIGAREMIDYAARLDAETTARIIKGDEKNSTAAHPRALSPRGAKAGENRARSPRAQAVAAEGARRTSAKTNDEERIKALCYRLWIEVIERFIVSAMHQTQDSAEVRAYNAHFSLRRFPHDLRWYKNALNGLARILSDDVEAIRLSELNKTGDLKKFTSDSGRLILARQQGRQMFREVEASKVRAQLEMAIAEKAANPELKIVFIYTFRKSIEIARHYLTKIYGEDQVGVLVGETSRDDRTRIIERFNARGNGAVTEIDIDAAERRQRRAARAAKRAEKKQDEVEKFGPFARDYEKSGRCVRMSEDEERSAIEADDYCAQRVPMLSDADIDDALDRYTEISPIFDWTNEKSRRVGGVPPGECPISFLIGQIELTSASINIEEKDGKTRMMFVGATSDVIALHQSYGRFKRAGSNGVGFVYVAYGLLEREDEELEIDENTTEQQMREIVASTGMRKRTAVDPDSGFVGVEANMFRALSRKTGILVDTLKTQVEDGTVFPGDYEVIHIR